MRLTPCLRAASYRLYDADDVGLQDRIERLLGGDAAQVNDGIHAFQQCVHRRAVFERGRQHFFAGCSGAEIGRVADTRNVVHSALQPRPQHAAQAAGGAGEQQAAEVSDACVGARHGHRPGTGSPGLPQVVMLSYNIIVEALPAVNAGTGFHRRHDAHRAVAAAARARWRSSSSMRWAAASATARWRAGDKLPTEAAIMEEFGVSRTVVREAISKLQAAGLVQTRHGVGTFVVGLRRPVRAPSASRPSSWRRCTT